MVTDFASTSPTHEARREPHIAAILMGSIGRCVITYAIVLRKGVKMHEIDTISSVNGQSIPQVPPRPGAIKGIICPHVLDYTVLDIIETQSISISHFGVRYNPEAPKVETYRGTRYSADENLANR